MGRRKKSKAKKEVTLLRKKFSTSRAMDVFDKAFRAAEQSVPVMKAYMQDPCVDFLVEAGALIAFWPRSVMCHVLTELTQLTPAQNLLELEKQVRRLLHEILGVKEVGDEYGKKRSRWMQWPHLRATPKHEVDSTRSKELTSEEKEKMASTKKAVKKKVVPAKAKGSAAKKAAVKKGGGKSAIANDTKLRVVEGSKKPALEERVKVKNSVKGTMTAEAIVKKAGCNLKTLGAMVRKGFLEIVK